MTITKTLCLLVALALLQGALSRPSRKGRQQQGGARRQGMNRGHSSSSEEGVAGICRIVNQTGTPEELCIEQYNSCPETYACKPTYMHGSNQIFACLEPCNSDNNPCASGYNCTRFGEDSTSYCLPEDRELFGSSESSSESSEDDDEVGPDTDMGGALAWWHFFGGGGRRKRQTVNMNDCEQVLCNIRRQGRRDMNGGRQGGRRDRDRSDDDEETTTVQNEPLFPGLNPGQNPEVNPGQNPGLNPGQNPGLNPGQPSIFSQNPQRRGGQRRGRGGQGSDIP